MFFSKNATYAHVLIYLCFFEVAAPGAAAVLSTAASGWGMYCGVGGNFGFCFLFSFLGGESRFSC